MVALVEFTTSNGRLFCLKPRCVTGLLAVGAHQTRIFARGIENGSLDVPLRLSRVKKKLGR